MNGVLLDPTTRWYCPSCGAESVTTESRPHSRMHSCPSLRGLTAPMVPAGTRAEHRVNDREDYSGGDILPTDGEGNVVMSLTTVRDEGEDCVVYAPTATNRSQ